jgi:leukotriene-A4 hydrolase
MEQKLQIDAWVYGPGIPSNTAVAHSDAFTKVEEQIKLWSAGTPAKKLDTGNWTTQEWIHFLRNLPEPLKTSQMTELDESFQFSKTGNADIMNEWLLQVIKNQYGQDYVVLEHFLISQGRRKYLKPLYAEMAKTENGMQMAKRIYTKARPTYHSVSVAVVDSILKWPSKPGS